MPFTTKTRDELIRAFTNVIRGLIPGADTSVGSDYHIMATVLADVFRGNQSQALWLSKQIFPGTADADYVMLHAALRGLTQQQAAGASGKVILLSTSSDMQAEGSTLTHADGTVYETTDSVVGLDAGWTGSGDKTVGKGSTVGRILIKDADGLDEMRVGDVFQINGETSAIKELVSSITAIDIYPPLSEAPAEDDAIVAKRGAVVDIICQSTGLSTNKDPADTLTLDSPATGFQNTAWIAELSGGGDIETAAELGARCQSHDSQGIDATPEAYRTLARECPDVRVADAIVFSNFRGLGAHDIVLMGFPNQRVMGTIPVVAVQAHIDANTMDDIVVKAIEYDVYTAYNMDIKIRGIPGYEKDWSGDVTSLTVDDPPGTTTTINYKESDRPLEVGDRVVIARDLGSGYKDIQLVIVTKIEATQTFHFTPALAAACVENDLVYAAGPLTEPILEALNTLLDNLGPAATTGSGPWTQNDMYECQPVPGIEWDEWLRLSAIHAACMAVGGMDAVDIVSPTSDKLPSVQRVVRPKYVLVRYGV